MPALLWWGTAGTRAGSSARVLLLSQGLRRPGGRGGSTPPDEVKGLVGLRRPLRHQLVVAGGGEGREDAVAGELGAGLGRLPDIDDDDLTGWGLGHGMADQARGCLVVEVHHLGDLLVLGAGGGLADLEDRHRDPSLLESSLAS